VSKILIDNSWNPPNLWSSTIRQGVGLMEIEDEKPSEQTTQRVRAVIRKALATHRDKVKGTSEEKEIDDVMKWIEKTDAEEKSRQR
jgi:hypothetical protein